MGNGFRLPYDYGEWKTGYRTEGLVNSACSFGYKIGNGIGSALLGMILEVAVYVGDAAVQSASALRSIEVLLRMDSDRCLCMWSDHHEILETG